MRRAAPLLLLLACAACAAPRCRNDIARRVPAPDGTRDAVVYHRDCGDGTGAGTAVAVIPHDADLPDVPTYVLGLSKNVEVSASWATPIELRLEYPASAVVLGRMERSLDGVALRFEPH